MQVLKAMSWKWKPQSAGNYLGLLFALPQSVADTYALCLCKCLADDSIPSGWGSLALPPSPCISVHVSFSPSRSPSLLAGSSVGAVGRSDQNKNSNTRHRWGNKAKWSIEAECLPSPNYIELFLSLSLSFSLPPLTFFITLWDFGG